MTFFQIYFQALLVILGMMSFLWIISIIIKNVSIVDLFWGFGFVLANVFYFISTEGIGPRKLIVLILVTVWGLRLSGYLSWRNIGKGEDFRYRQFQEQIWRGQVLVDKLLSNLSFTGYSDVAHFSSPSRC